MIESSAPIAAHGRGDRRILLGTLSALLVIAFLSVYGSNITRIVVLWFTRPHSYAQGALIFIVSMYMVFHHASELRRLWIRSTTVVASDMCGSGVSDDCCSCSGVERSDLTAELDAGAELTGRRCRLRRGASQAFGLCSPRL